MNVASVDANAKLVLRLAWRTCETPEPVHDAGAPDGGAGDAGGRRVRLR